MKEKISEMPAATSLSGTELIPIVQSGANKTVTPLALYKLSLNAQVVNYILTIDDNYKLVSITTGGAGTLTVPPNNSVNFPVGAVIAISANGAGQITVVAGNGVTILSADNALKLRVQYSSASLIQLSVDTWLLIGDIEA